MIPSGSIVASGRTLRADVIRVLVVDDSGAVRRAVRGILEQDPGIQVAAEAPDGETALTLVGGAQFDLALLDVEMPGLGGLATLPRLLAADPGLPVVMNSSLTLAGAETTLRALRLGAADYIAKPAPGALHRDDFKRELLVKVRGLGGRRRAEGWRLAACRQGHPALVPASIPDGIPSRAARGSGGLERAPLLIAVGSSTGGPQALFALLDGLGPDLPVPVVVAQHMPEAFTTILATHLDRHGTMRCHEARDREKLLASNLYIAPGNRHLVVERDAGGLRGRLSDAAPENFCRPSVDVLLRSASAACDGRVLVVMLTGMGHDGLEGTRAAIAAGGAAIAQDEATSVVWGMPGAVAQAGLCREVLPLSQLGRRARQLASKSTAALYPSRESRQGARP